MPCQHKFHSYLNLNKGYLNPELNKLDFEPTTLIVGTFNPAWPLTNEAEWFYGRTKNNYFWEVLPRVYGKESLINATHTEWKSFCYSNKIAITDLIFSIEEANEENKDHLKMMGGYSDSAIKGFKNNKETGIVSVLTEHPNISNVYLTRGIGDTYWKKLWKPIKDYCELHNKSCKTLLTPSGYAFYQHGSWNKNNPHAKIDKLEDFILKRWKEQWHC